MQRRLFPAFTLSQWITQQHRTLLHMNPLYALDDPPSLFPIPSSFPD